MGLHADAAQRERDMGGWSPADAKLRRHGFIIWRRPRRGPPVWWKGGREYTEAEALAAADEALKAVASGRA